MSGILRCVSVFSPSFTPNFSVRFRKIKRFKKPLPEEVKFQSQEDSLAVRGFLRSFKPYTPPSDVSEKLNHILDSLGVPNKRGHLIDDPALRFTVLNECFKEFQHCVPNSILHTMNTVGEISSFYNTPISTTVPYDELKDMDLPKNLHIQYDYVRFHPDTDTMFEGKTAFPKRSNVVTGLKYKKKYPGFTVKTSWP